MRGERIPDGEWPEEPGQYSKHVVDGNVGWVVKVPTGGQAIMLGTPNPGGQPYHWVRENEDGTITVEPNPPDAPPERRGSNSIQWHGWHGYIRDGVWEPVE